MKLPAAALAALLVSNSVTIQAQQQAATPASAATSTPAPGQAADPNAVAKPTVILPNTLMDGTEVKLKTASEISSGKQATGDRVSFVVTEDVLVDGKVVIAKGAQALGTVKNAQPKKNMGRAGKLDVKIDSARLVSGEKVELRATKAPTGGSHVGAMTGAMIATSIVFFPAAPLFLFMKGKDIVIPKDTEITAFVEGDQKLDSPKPETAGGVVVIQTASVVVDASVPGADITVDGNFMGNTPSTLTLAPGSHTILVQKKGYADWSRTMNVAGNGVHLNADLEAKP